MERNALRYAHLAEDVTRIAVSYHNLGDYFRDHAHQSVPALASHLMSALICALTGVEGTDDSVRDAAADLREFGTAAEAPADVADLCRTLGDIPGTDPAGLITRLSPDPETAERTLRDLIARAQAIARGGGGVATIRSE